MAWGEGRGEQVHRRSGGEGSGNYKMPTHLGLTELGPYLQSLASHKGIHVVNMVLYKHRKCVFKKKAEST